MIAAWWKLVAIALLLALVGSSGYLGAKWYGAVEARDEAFAERDKAKAELKAEKVISAELGLAVDKQNAAADALDKATKEADARGAQAQQIAAQAGKRFDAATARLASAKATSCAEAMPYVNQMLESVR